jgi:exosortase K
MIHPSQNKPAMQNKGFWRSEPANLFPQKRFLAAGGNIDIIILLFTIIIAIGLKYFYSQASTENLNWILAPTVEMVELISGITFDNEVHTGFISKTHRFIIAKSCAGINFLIIVFCMLIFSRIQQVRLMGMGAKILFVIKSGITAYFLTIMANAVRIIVAIYLFEAEFYSASDSGWFAWERLHRIEGTAIYFFFLCLLYFGIVRRFNKNRFHYHGEIKNGKSLWLSTGKTPLFWYLLVTLLVPLIRRSLKGNLTGFFEHSIVVIIISMTILLLFILVRSMVRRVKNFF